jgi:hypothetical protein
VKGGSKGLRYLTRQEAESASFWGNGSKVFLLESTR